MASCPSCPFSLPLILFPGGRSRFRNSNSNNPNLMYQDECDRRMRSAGGGSSSKDGRSGGGGSYSRSGNTRDGDRSSSSSYRDCSSRDGGCNYGSSSTSYNQYQNNNSSRSGSGGSVVPPPSSGPQPLMAQQFNPPQPMMGLMGHSPFQFGPPPLGRKWCGLCINVTQHNTHTVRFVDFALFFSSNILVTSLFELIQRFQFLQQSVVFDWFQVCVKSFSI